jgi:serine/threonine protein kinase
VTLGGHEPGVVAGETPNVMPSTGHGVVLGTPGYMAPEQAAGDPALVDARADVYSLGAILRDLCTAASDGADDHRSDRALPRPLQAIIHRAMAADPNARYQDVTALARDVASFRAGEPVSAYRENVFERVRRFATRYSTPILLVLAYLVMRITLFAVRGR